MTAIMNFLGVLDDFVWGPPMMIALVGTGIFLTIRLGFPQFKHTGYALKLIFKGAMNDPAASRRVSKIRTALIVSNLPSVYLVFVYNFPLLTSFLSHQQWQHSIHQTKILHPITLF